MEEVRRLLEELLTFELIQATVSAPRMKSGICKIKIRPVILKDELVFQASLQEEKKVFHKNYGKEAMAEALTGWLAESFGQLQADLPEETVTVLTSRKGKVTIRRKRRQETKTVPALLSHNRKKHYILEEGVSVPFLVDLGVMTEEGKVVKARYDKYRQINRFLEFIEDILPKLPRDREVTIVDFGCGKSYLTFAMYYYLHEQKGLDIRIIGLDLKEDVIAHCAKLADRYGYEKLTFLVGDIASYEGLRQVDMVVTLHACDTATDAALYKAVNWGASVILSVPCCQHECNGQLQRAGREDARRQEASPLQAAFKYGLIRERMAALFTDAIRANLLEEQGYQVQILEFIDMEHTPKNILIRAVKSWEKKTDEKGAGELSRFLQVELTLERLLKERG